MRFIGVSDSNSYSAPTLMGDTLHNIHLLSQRIEQIMHQSQQASRNFLLTSNTQIRPFESDALSLFAEMPLCVALPINESEVIAVMRACSELSIPVVTRGSGTGLSGGATPVKNAVLLVLSRMNQIIEIDAENAIACVQPGVRNISISEAAATSGLYYAPDPSSQVACSIGGNVAENSGGVHCLKYGLTVHNVLKIRVVLIGGDVVELGALAPDAPGLNLLHAFIGSEGLLGVVTQIWVKLIPKPKLAQVILASFPTIESAAQAVTHIIASGLIPAGLEMMDQDSTIAVENYLQAGYDTQAAAILLCESDGEPTVVAQEIEQMSQILKDSGASRLQISCSESERLLFWSGRKSAFPAAAKLAPDYYCMDGTIPRKQLATMLKALKEMEHKYNIRCLNMFHAGDGNLHPLVLFDATDADSMARAEQMGQDILQKCIDLGGTITGEHGVGLEKIGHMCAQFSSSERETMWAFKRAFDPDQLLNPGKAIPTLHRCAEFGRMHVHHGQLPFPDLPRF